MWYDYEWVRWVLHVVGVAVGIVIGRRFLGRPPLHGDTRSTYVVCPRCGRRRGKRYRMGGEPLEEGMTHDE